MPRNRQSLRNTVGKSHLQLILQFTAKSLEVISLSPLVPAIFSRTCRRGGPTTATSTANQIPCTSGFSTENWTDSSWFKQKTDLLTGLWSHWAEC